MISLKITSFTKKLNSSIHYCWIIMIVTFLALMAAAGVRASPGILIIRLESFFGWNRTIISFPIAINLLLYGLIGPFAVAMMEIYGIRRVMTAAFILLAFGTGLSAWMKTPWQMTILWGVLVGIGTGFLSSVLGTVIAKRWFFKQQSLIIGIFSAAGPAGQLLFLPFLSLILSYFDWKMVVWTVSSLSLALTVLVALLIRDTPEEMSLRPYGAENCEEWKEVPFTDKNPLKLVLKGLKIAVHSKDFWIISGSFFVCGATSNGLIATHFIPACSDHGMSEITASGMLSAAGVFNIIGATLSGWLSDKFDNRKLLFILYLFRGISLFLLPFSFSSNLLGLTVFIVFYGLEWTATVPPTVRLTTDAFGSEGGVVFGWMLALHQVGAALAAFMGGYLHTLTSSYLNTFISAAVLCILASLLVIRLKTRN